MRMIPFNKPYLSGKELEYISEAVALGQLSGNGVFTRRCHEIFRQRYGFGDCFLTSSCTDALEMIALLLNLQPGDEVIFPSYGFVSTVNAFVLRGITPVFADSLPYHPNVDVRDIERKITPNTKAVVVIHYAGMACDMDALLKLKAKHGFALVEDAAQAIDTRYKGKALGSFGEFAAFSFHETKNVFAGEGGMLVVNASSHTKRAEILWEKGTNRTAFYRGEVDKYTWQDIGSSFLPSEVTAAFLYAQLEHIDEIMARRVRIWQWYETELKDLENGNRITLPQLPEHATNNGHIFYILCTDKKERTKLIEYLSSKKIMALFHYLPLHESPFYTKRYEPVSLPNAEAFADRLLRLPLYYEIKQEEVQFVCNKIKDFYR